MANNTSNVTVKVKFYRTNTGYSTYGTGTVYCKINGVKYSASVTNSQKITSDGIVLFSKTLNISHGTNGAKTLTCSAWISHSVVSSEEQSYSQTLTTIPRKSSLSVANGTLGTIQTLTVTKQSDSFTHTIAAVCGTASATICTKSSATSVSFTPPLAWASQNKTGTSVSVTYTITTYSGSSNVGSSSYTKTCAIPASVKPTISSVLISDAMGYEDTYGTYLKGLSKFKIAVTASGSYSSTIKAYKIQADGSTYTSANVTTSVIQTSGTATVSVAVTDSRGRSVSKSFNTTVASYVEPKILSLSAKRCDSEGNSDDQGEFIKITFYTYVSALSDKNTAKYVLKYKKTSNSAWTSIDTSELSGNYEVSNKSYIFSADTGSSYSISLTASDSFKSVTKTVSASTATTILHFNASGNGVGIGKISETKNTLDVNYKSIFRGGNDAATAVANSGAVLVGNPSGQHITIDGNEILAKSDSTTAGLLYLQIDGGTPCIGSNCAQVGYNRFQSGWIGFYRNQTDARNATNRIAYIGPDSTTATSFGIWNEMGGDILSNVTIRTSGIFSLAAAKSVMTSLNCHWNDGDYHDIVSRAADGLSCYMGPGNFGSSYHTITNIRGYTVRLYNHGGGTYLGSSGSTAVTSDKNLKKDIFDMSDSYVKFFKRLRPVSYKYNSEDNNGHRDHLGFIAQEVEDALTESGLTTEQFAGICIENDVTLDYNDDTALTDEERAANKIHYDKLYSLRYEEFIALNTHMIQNQQAVIEELQNKIDTLEARLVALEKIMEG